MIHCASNYTIVLCVGPIIMVLLLLYLFSIFFLGDDLLYLQSGKLETSVRCKIFLFLRYESKIWLSPGINNVSEP